MKWLSVDVDIHNDPKVGRLIREEGHEAGWLYVVILAEIAKDIDFKNDSNGVLDTGGDSPSVWLAWTQNISEEKAESFFNSCAEIGLIDLNKWEEDEEVFVPKILERKQVKNFIKMQKRGSKGGEKSRKHEETGENGKENNPPSSPQEGGGTGGSKGSVTNKDEDEELEEEIEQTKPSGLGDRPDPEEADFSEKQEYLATVLSESDIPETSLWGLVGKWINHYGFEDVADAAEELSMKGKLEGLDKPGYIVGTINNDYENSTKDYPSLPALDELEEKQEGYWESVLPDCYSDESYPSMIYAEDVRKIAGMLDGHGEARAVKLLEEYFSDHDDKSELGEWLKDELDRSEEKQPA